MTTTKIMLVGNDKEAVKKFLETYGGRQLLKEHKLTDIGIWRVYGEDPNCDMGGYHHEPLLGTYKGKLEDIIEVAIKLPRFYNWGAGGRIEALTDPAVVEVVRE